MKNQFQISFLALALLLMPVLAGCSSGQDTPSRTKHTVEFYAEGYKGNASEQLSDRMDLDAKPAQLFRADSGEEYMLQLVSSNVGALRYTFETEEEAISLDQLRAVMPIQYVEAPAEDSIQIPLAGDSAWLKLTVSDNEGSGLEVAFTALRLDTLPYEMVLVSGGEHYESLSTDYRFDSATGELEICSLVFPDLTAAELTADAYLETDRVLIRYELTELCLVE